MSKKTKRRKNNIGYAVASAHNECTENIESIKARVKQTKANLKAVTELAIQGVFDYDVKDEIVGKAYLDVLRAKNDLQHRKSMR